MKDLLELLMNSTSNWVARIGFGFLILIGVCVFDNYMGISYYSDMKNKTEIIKTSNEILSQSTVDSVTKVKIKLLQNDVLTRENFLSNAYHRLLHKSLEPSSPKNFIAIYVSSTWGLLLMMIGILIPPKKAIPYNIGFKFAIIMLLLAISIAFYAIFNLIPIIAGDWIFNYLLNFILSAVIIVTILITASKTALKTDQYKNLTDFGKKKI